MAEALPHIASVAFVSLALAVPLVILFVLIWKDSQ